MNPKCDDTKFWRGEYIAALQILVFVHQTSEQLDRKREDDRGVPFGSDVVERLQVTELKSGWWLIDDISSLFEGPRGILFTFSSYDLKKRNGKNIFL